LSSARERYWKLSGFSHPEAIRLYKLTIQLREMPGGECQVIRFIDKEEHERVIMAPIHWPYEHGALVLARAKSWKELGL